MPSWPWSPKLARSQDSSRPASAGGTIHSNFSSASLAPWVDPELSSDDDGANSNIGYGDNEDNDYHDGDELVHLHITKAFATEDVTGPTVRGFSAHHSPSPSRLKSATRSRRTLRRQVPSFDDIANSIPEEAVPEYYNENLDAATTSATSLNFYEQPSQEFDFLFPGNPEDFQPIQQLQSPTSSISEMPHIPTPPISPPPRKSSNKASRSPKRKDKTKDQNKVVESDPDLPLLYRESFDIDEEFPSLKMPSANSKPQEYEESLDSEVVRLRKMCGVLQEKIIQMSQHVPPVAVAKPSKRSSLILGDRLSRSRLKDAPSEELASEGHRVAHVMRVMNEQLQKKLELREKLLFQRNAHISQLERTHATQVEEFHAATKTDIQKMVSAYQRELSEMHQRNLLQITNLRNELEGKLRVKEQQSRDENATLQEEIESLKKRETDLVVRHEISRKEREVLFERDMASLRESITATEAEFQKNYEAKLEDLRLEHEKEIVRLKKEIITRPLDLTNDVDKDIVAHKISDLESALATHLEELAGERERALELQVALDASEFGRQTEREKLEAAVREETTKREEFQKHEQRIRAQLLAASDTKRKECLKHERARYERLVREENVRRKAASDRYESELKELKQKNNEQLELFRMQKESIFELHEKDVQELERKISAERMKTAGYETVLETVKSSRQEDHKRFENEKAGLIASLNKEREAFAKERRLMAAAQSKDKKLANAEKEALEINLKRMSNNCEELLQRRARDSMGSSRRSCNCSESATLVAPEDDAERRIAEEVAKVTAQSELQQKASTEAFERQVAVLKAELQSLQKMQTRVNAQIAEDEKKIAALTMELDFKTNEVERQARVIADLELQLESEKGKFKDVLERNVSLEKSLWEQKEAANQATKTFQTQIKALNDENQNLLATIASAGLEDERDAGKQLKAAISLGYETELRELESRHKEVIQNNVSTLYQLENLVRHYVNSSGEPPRSPSSIGTPRIPPYFLGENSTQVTDLTPSLTTAHSTTSSAGSIRSVPPHEPGFEPIFEPTFAPAVAKENSQAEADYIAALKQAEDEAERAAKPPSDRGDLLINIQTKIQSFKIQRLSFPSDSTAVKAA
ncbi:hypothetical protein DRE_02279 [Drechslerella stenobrocha 248]|uniref:Uncharacterized protein n=1 Tax=Drechslerella stenobrocha 248 TaxID=1043628 RepID=W7IG74_9PEZI|nr:hypothetical protein DRE_02279 [Drechslerella stenobrocha 248]